MSLASLIDTVPVEHVKPVARWFLRELEHVITERDEDLKDMHRLGIDGVTLAAHREASNDLKKVVDRWRQALTPATEEAGHA